MKFIAPLFSTPVPVMSDQGDPVIIYSLTSDLAQRHADVLVAIHNLIPFARWMRDEFLAENIGERIFHQKWALSLLITDSGGTPVGFLLSYLRQPDSNLDQVSVYMHRMAILEPLQRRGIGRKVITLYLERVFDTLSVDYVTLQANDTPQNTRIIGLYESLGFRKLKHVRYAEKTDWLMACQRSDRTIGGTNALT